MNPNLVIFYVADLDRSVAFYEALLGRSPADRFPTYAAFAFGNGLNLGLLPRNSAALAALPAGSAAGSQGELAFMVADAAAVEAAYADWRQRGLPIAQEIAMLSFGRTFVGLDPDGHRLRVCTPDR